MSRLIVSSSPHIHKAESVRKIMWTVIACLVPAGIAGVCIFGPSALEVIMLAVFSAVVMEVILQKLTNRKITVLDGSAVLTGLLLAYNLPAHVPVWLPIVGAAFAIAIGKQIFGGLGQNIFNPALVGRAFLVASWPKYMTVFTQPFNYDAVTSATPLALMKHRGVLAVPYMDLLVGGKGGCIGEVCVAALLAGAAYLLYKKYISWHIPATFVVTTALFTWIFSAKTFFAGDWLFHILSGGLILGACFMATDYVTSPLTVKGQVVFGIGCGLLTAIVRIWGGYPEGVSYSILIMNAVTPLIDRYTKTKIYGTKGLKA